MHLFKLGVFFHHVLNFFCIYVFGLCELLNGVVEMDSFFIMLKNLCQTAV